MSRWEQRAFSIPEADLERETLLRHRDPPPADQRRGSRASSGRQYHHQQQQHHHQQQQQSASSSGDIAFRARSKSKSRARAMPHRPAAGQEVFPLGGGHQTSNSNKASYYRQSSAASMGSARGRSRSVDATSSGARRTSATSAQPKASTRRAEPPPASRAKAAAAPDARRSSPVGSRTRSKSAARTTERRRSVSRQRHSSRSTAHAGSSRAASPRGRASTSHSGSKRRERTPSPPPARRSPSRQRRASSAARQRSALEQEMAETKRDMAKGERELEELRAELALARTRVEEKEYQLEDLRLKLEGLESRQALAQRFQDGKAGHDQPREDEDRRHREHSSRSHSRRSSERRPRSPSRSRASKRPRIIDEDDEDGDDDDEVEIIEVKQEKVDASLRPESRDSDGRSRQPTAVPMDSPPRQPSGGGSKLDPRREEEIPDYFWGRSDTPKLLVNHRFKPIPDGSARKGRHLSINPMKPSIFATSADEGGLILWNYNNSSKEIAKVVSLVPTSFRHDNPCAESIAWSPDGNRLAMAFRDPLDGKGEFCVVRLHQLGLKDSSIQQAIPKSRLTSKVTTLHPKGVSAIDWIPSGSGNQMTSHKLVTTGGSDHAVVLWTEHNDEGTGEIGYNWQVLHREHKSDIKALCIHSQRNLIYTGGLDGLVMQYDVNRLQTQVVMERRKPTISRINAVLEHPHNPNILLVSSLEQAEHNILLHDLRERYRSKQNATMTLTWADTQSKSTSQYIVPRWSPAGYHVSCGSKTGVVNIWDVRMRGSKYPTVLPQQSLRLHRTCLAVCCVPAALTETNVVVCCRRMPQRKRCSTRRGTRCTTPSSPSRTTARSASRPSGEEP